MSWRAELRAWWTTSRPEFAVGPTFSQGGVAALLALHQRPADLAFAWLLAAGLGICWMSISVGASLNCLADYETDRLDSADKARLARAVDVLGSIRLWRIILTEIGILTLAIVALALLLKRPLLFGFWLTGLVLAFMYSFEPYRIKGRGLLNPAVAAFNCTILPMLFVYHLLSPRLAGPATVVILLFGAQVWGLMLANQVSDYEEDKYTGTLTACVRYGRYRTVRLVIVAYACATAGMVGAVWCFWPTPATGALVLRLLALALYLWVLLDLVRLGRLARAIERGGPVGASTTSSIALKRRVAVAKWCIMIGLGAWALLSVP